MNDAVSFGRFVLVVFLFAPTLRAQQPVLPNGYRSVDGDRVQAMRELCVATAETGLFSGAVLVADEGQVIYKQAFGMANREWEISNTTDTRFRLASVSKQFCSMLILQLVQEGRLQLDDRITQYLTWYRKDTGDRITLHHLLSHQSGIPDFTSQFNYRGMISRLSFDRDEFIKEHCSGDLANEPGTIYSYSNAGYIILGRIVEKVTRKTYEQNLHERIFKPLEMNSSGYDRNRYVIPKRASGYTCGPFGTENADYIELDSSPGAAGALYSTVEDMFLWDRGLTSDVLLNEEYRRLMFTPNGNVPEVKAAGGRPRSIYGYGWQISTRTHPVTKRTTKVVSHGGAITGFRAMENRLVDDDAFVIVLCNLGDRYGSSDVWKSVTRLSGELVHVVLGEPYRMPPKRGMTQDQRMYEMARSKGAEAAIDWFRKSGRKAAWGGANVAVAEQLIRDGAVEDGLRLLEFDVEMTSGKAWLVRRTAEAFLNNGRPAEALKFVAKGLELKPNDERFLEIQAEAEQDLNVSSHDK